jgi:hypothetical protein
LSDVIQNEEQAQRVWDVFETIRRENDERARVEDYQREEQAKSAISDELNKKIK